MPHRVPAALRDPGRIERGIPLPRPPGVEADVAALRRREDVARSSRAARVERLRARVVSGDRVAASVTSSCTGLSPRSRTPAGQLQRGHVDRHHDARARSIPRDAVRFRRRRRRRAVDRAEFGLERVHLLRLTCNSFERGCGSRPASAAIASRCSASGPRHRAPVGGPRSAGTATNRRGPHATRPLGGERPRALAVSRYPILRLSEPLLERRLRGGRDGRAVALEERSQKRRSRSRSTGRWSGVSAPPCRQRAPRFGLITKSGLLRTLTVSGQRIPSHRSCENASASFSGIGHPPRF